MSAAIENIKQVSNTMYRIDENLKKIESVMGVKPSVKREMTKTDSGRTLVTFAIKTNRVDLKGLSARELDLALELFVDGFRYGVDAMRQMSYQAATDANRKLD